MHTHTHSVEKREILSHWKKFLWNQLFSNSFSETVIFTKFFPKNRESKFPKFPHCACSVEYNEILSHWKKISWKQLFSNSFSKNVIFTNFLSKYLLHTAYYQECNVQNNKTTIDVEHCINVHKSAYMNVRMNFSNQIVMKYLSGLYKIAYPCHLVYEIWTNMSFLL